MSAGDTIPSEAAEAPERPRIVLGVDLLENERLLDLHRRYGERFLRRLFTTTELEQAGWRAERLVSRFAAKEAAGKALGTGMVTVAWREIEVLRISGGKPALRLHGRAAARARLLGIAEFDLSISDTKTHTVAVVVGVRDA
ncbi:MAG TPA: holo-ACP synthase [Ktedonobacterales bacterium]|nr:holo-ACP synthase [Ktedonobacterales bacterium]